MQKHNLIKMTSYSDESGQETKGKVFICCTICFLSEDINDIEIALLAIEKEVGKDKKWSETGNMRQHQYLKVVKEKKLLNNVSIYYSAYENKTDYPVLMGTHIAKAILDKAASRPYITKVFIDKTDNTTLDKIKKEIKSLHIRYDKIRGLRDQSSAIIRLVDSICGMVRDMDRRNTPKVYKELFQTLKKI